jgi:hypothetical protein
MHYKTPNRRQDENWRRSNYPKKISATALRFFVVLSHCLRPALPPTSSPSPRKPPPLPPLRLGASNAAAATSYQEEPVVALLDAKCPLRSARSRSPPPTAASRSATRPLPPAAGEVGTLVGRAGRPPQTRGALSRRSLVMVVSPTTPRRLCLSMRAKRSMPWAVGVSEWFRLCFFWLV